MSRAGYCARDKPRSRQRELPRPRNRRRPSNLHLLHRQSLPAPSFPAPFASTPASSAQFASQHSNTPPPMASASAFELDAEPAPQPDAAEATLLEYMPDSAPSGADKSPRAAADSSQSKQYPWQPRSKPQAEPMASALRRAAEAAGKIEFEAPAALPCMPLRSPRLRYLLLRLLRRRRAAPQRHLRAPRKL